MSYENPKYIDQNPNAFMEAFNTSFKEGQTRLKEIEDREKERKKEEITYNERVGAILDPYNEANATALAGINASDESGRSAIMDAYKTFSSLGESIAKTGGTREQRAEAIRLKQSLGNLNTAKATFESTLQANIELEKEGKFSNTPENIRNRQIAEDYSKGVLKLSFDPKASSYVLTKEGQQPISLNNFLINKNFLKYDSKVDHSKFEGDMSKIIESKGQSMLKNIDTATKGGDKLRYLVIDPDQAVATMKNDATFKSYVSANASDLFYNTLSHSPSETLLKPNEEGYEAQQDQIAIDYATKVYSNNLAKPYASGAVTNVTQEAKDTRQKYLDAAKYGKDKDNKPTETEKNAAIRNGIYATASTLTGGAIIDKLFKLKEVLSNWERVAGNNKTLLKRKGTGVIETYNVAGKTPEQLKEKFDLQ